MSHICRLKFSSGSILDIIRHRSLSIHILAPKGHPPMKMNQGSLEKWLLLGLAGNTLSQKLLVVLGSAHKVVKSPCNNRGLSKGCEGQLPAAKMGKI